MNILAYLDSNLFQSIILVITVLTTLWIYYSNKKQNLRNAITILSIQIKDIEENIEFLIAEGIIDGLVQERSMHYSTLVYEDNYWSKYNHMIAGRVDPLTFEAIDNFYRIASKIREQQNLIKGKLSQSMEYRTMYYYNGIFSRVNGVLDKLNNSEGAEVLLNSCKNEIAIIRNLYSNTGDDIINHPAYIQLEFVRGLSKMLDRYQKLTDGVAYRQLLKLQK